MRLIDADALHEALMTKQKWVVRRGDNHNEGYTYDQVHFAIDEAPTIEAVSIDDYRSMENTCYKLQKALYEMADRKTENSSEKPNNCEQKNYCDDCLYTDTCDSKEFFYACTSKATISKMEQVDKDINVRSKDCTTCKHAGEIYEDPCELCYRHSHYEPKDEPQTEEHKCRRCLYYDIPSGYYPCSECVDYSNPSNYEPQTDCDHKCIQTEIGCEKTDCAWK